MSDSKVEYNRNIVLDIETRNASDIIQNLVWPKEESICSIEIDIDYLEEKYRGFGWSELFDKLTAKWVEENSYLGVGTIWSFGSPSVNFHHQSYSLFLAIVGMPNRFREYINIEIEVLGKQVRPNSDYILLSREDGWDVRCHIQEGKVWEKNDDIEWVRINI